jgi:thiamine-phosphate pyrophosphorylase
MVPSMLDPFYLIVSSLNWMQRLVPLGVKLVQLRIKDASEEELRQQVRAAKQLCENHGAQLRDATSSTSGKKT